MKFVDGLFSKLASGFNILKQNGMEDLATFVFNIREHMTPTRKFFDFVNKLTLADRIKGNAKLSGILKANANPSNGAMPSTGIRPDGTTR